MVLVDASWLERLALTVLVKEEGLAALNADSVLIADAMNILFLALTVRGQELIRFADEADFS